MNDIIGRIIDELGLDRLDTYGQSYLVEQTTFTEAVKEILSGGSSVFEALGRQLVDAVSNEIMQTKEYIVGMLVFLLTAAMFNRMVNSKNSYLNSVSFLMVYGALMLILMESFTKIEGLVTSAIDGVIGFMNMMIPVYASTLVMTGNISTGSAYYIFSFGCLYIIEWISKLVLVPAVQIFLFLVLINNMFEEDSLSKLAELLEKIIRFALKLSTGAVFGMGLVQRMVATARDDVANSLALKTIKVIPGIGNAVSATGETLLSCGVLIKNCVGVVGIIIILSILLAPLIRILIFILGYKLTSAIVQPIAGKIYILVFIMMLIAYLSPKDEYRKIFQFFVGGIMAIMLITPVFEWVSGGELVSGMTNWQEIQEKVDSLYYEPKQEAYIFNYVDELENQGQTEEVEME